MIFHREIFYCSPWSRISGETLVARLQEFLRPAIVEILVDPLGVEAGRGAAT
jgi:hypothetical protein